MTKRTYFYKADDFPEVIVNKSGKIKSLAESCQVTLPGEKRVEKEEDAWKDVEKDLLNLLTHMKKLKDKGL